MYGHKVEPRQEAVRKAIYRQGENHKIGDKNTKKTHSTNQSKNQEKQTETNRYAEAKKET